MNYHSTTIAQILLRINRDVLIPGIQRPFVWETDQVIRLFDSLMRGYPINSFLFWELLPENYGDWDIYKFVKNFQQGNIHNERAEPEREHPATLVLDGQQRLTSLLIGLAGKYRVRNGKRGKGAAWTDQILFLNLLESPHFVGDVDDNETVMRDIHYGFKFLDADKPRKCSAEIIWFKVGDILSITDEAHLSGAIEQLHSTYPHLTVLQSDILKINLTRLYEAVWQDDCISFYLEKDQSYDKVLDIFIRANDGGTKLSRSDLLMSMVTLRWERFNARDETETLTYHLRDVLEHDKSFDRDFLLRSGLFFNNLDFAFQIRNFTPRNISILEAKWLDITKALKFSAELFGRYGVIGGSLTATNAVMLLACYVYKVNCALSHEEWSITSADEETMRRWIISVLFHGALSGAANITMELYRRIITHQIDSGEVSFPARMLNERMTKRGRFMGYDDAAVARFCSIEGKARYGQTCLSLLYDHLNFRNTTYQIVQIMPSHRLFDARLQAAGLADIEIPVVQSWAGKVANHVLMDEDEARQYYEMDFDDWVKTRSTEFFRRHLLPDDPMQYDEYTFLDFIAARSKLISLRLSSLFGDAIASERSEVEAINVADDEELIP